MYKAWTRIGAAGCAVFGLFMAGPATAGGVGPGGAGAGGAGAGGAGADQGQVAPALRPPVITEAFKPVLACDENTTIGQEGCGERQVIAVDTRLDGDVRVIFTLLRDNVAVRSFVTAETAWLTYRNEDCASQSDVYEGGTEQPVAYVYCLAADDASRRQDLKGFFQALAQGLAKVPKFP
jgi:uncharacterized protein YecT (DUF1311 family)